MSAYSSLLLKLHINNVTLLEDLLVSLCRGDLETVQRFPDRPCQTPFFVKRWVCPYPDGGMQRGLSRFSFLHFCLIPLLCIISMIIFSSLLSQASWTPTNICRVIISVVLRLPRIGYMYCSPLSPSRPHLMRTMSVCAGHERFLPLVGSLFSHYSYEVLPYHQESFLWLWSVSHFWESASSLCS